MDKYFSQYGKNAKINNFHRYGFRFWQIGVMVHAGENVLMEVYREKS